MLMPVIRDRMMTDTTYLTTETRILHRLCSDIASELGITMTSFSEGWVIRLEIQGIRRHIYGHNFELNSATARNIASDKAATVAILRGDNVPCVEHRLFRHPDINSYVDPQGNWNNMRQFASAHNYDIVCKPNESSGGHRVFHVTNPRALEAAVHELFTTERSICLCPYIEAEREIRVIILNDNVELIYAKHRPTVTGDGRSTIAELINKSSNNQADPDSLMTLLKETPDESRFSLSYIPDAGQIVPLGWKHNLRTGGQPSIVADSKAEELARKAAASINLAFGAVDILDTAQGQYVLEINSGFMVTHFVRSVPDGENIARDIYRKAIRSMFPEILTFR